MLSRSAKIRQKGNELFKIALGEQVPKVRRERLTNARGFFTDALQAATNDDDKASAMKNLGTTFFRIATTFALETTFSPVELNSWKNAFSNLSSSEEVGKKCKQDDWIESIQQVENDLLEQFQARISSVLELSSRIPEFWVISGDLPARGETVASSLFHLAFGRLLFHSSVQSMENGEIAACQKALNDANAQIEMAKFGARKTTYGDLVLNESKELQEKIEIHFCICAAIQTRLQAERCLTSILNDSDDLNIEMAWQICDNLRHSIVLTRGKDLENEAIASSLLGRIFGRILKIEKYAVFHYRHVLELAEAMKPRVVTSQPWFQESQTFIEEQQRKARAKLEEEREEERITFLEDLKPELQELKEASEKGAIDFLETVYTKWPPKNDEEFKFDPPTNPTDDQKKKLLRKASFHYHPDKQVNFERRWQIFAEEILKKINAKYEVFK